MGARLSHHSFSLNISKNNRRSSIFRALSSQLIFFSHGEDRFLLTFMNFFLRMYGPEEMLPEKKLQS